MPIDRKLEALILQEYGTEPYPHTYTQQDLLEQIRKLILQYNRGPQTRPVVPIEVLLLQIERHVRLEQAAAESFHDAPTVEALHAPTTSPLMH